MLKKFKVGILFSMIILSISSIGPCNSVSAASNQKKNIERAVISYESLQKYFYKSDVKLYTEEFPHVSNNPYAFVWPYARAMAATIDMSRLPKIGEKYVSDRKDRLTGLELYWNNETTPKGYDSYVRPPIGNGGDKFYDDNDWIALNFIKLYEMTGDKNALERAKEIFKLQVYGWDDDSSHPSPGGVFWTQAPWSNDRNTISNAPVAQIGLYLYEITGEKYYFDWAKKTYDWVNSSMLAPNGLYWDHIDLQGNIEKTQWTYNQGMMLGANVLFYKTTGDDSYLKLAEEIADKSLQYYDDSKLYNQPPEFNAIFFENLQLLESVNHQNKYRKYIQSYADGMWKTVRDPETGLFPRDNNKPVPLIEQAAMVEIYANLAKKSDEK
ncbi:glycoside hydrolase family 76 protein [Peribacillus muralis]|uniref:glycoside hydrolase family 76 protein n=1 Tax=Peribacillus muralis TaxID=264697 RepID=UPI00070B5B40|nr:glycoside hydrolase family 76 protein [Peribacillus muralis]